MEGSRHGSLYVGICQACSILLVSKQKTPQHVAALLRGVRTRHILETNAVGWNACPDCRILWRAVPRPCISTLVPVAA